MRRAAPSIFAARPHPSLSERFRAIPTIEVLRGLEKEVFLAVGVEAISPAGRQQDRLHAAHDPAAPSRRCAEIPSRRRRLRDLLKNANDGTSAYELMAGLFRIRCLNSLVAQIATIDSIKVRHSGDALQKVVDGTYRVLGEAEAVLAAPQDWSRIALDYDAKAALAASAHALRFGDADGKVATPIKPARAHAAPRRRPRQRPVDDAERRSGERHARRSVGARAGDHGPAWTLAAGPPGDDARGRRHRPGRKAQQGAVGSRRAHGELARTGRVAAPRCRVQRV